ncbi:LOW QUALITY PROTEIN: inactive pancreatic lipase-related protein 1-like [Polypterus senegalus]|uniref:LOW QUALITY PROTEIN: inactive pancreatic lipase-related protein 1-like n=1 Tax=Polypterus senegalus TaxID=55291 RepID=UPI00196487C2|nr:LOW QUALITY PROTEIN: inactive pancreatic lipase-related protein 1-like [Polypterus senegalus]
MSPIWLFGVLLLGAAHAAEVCYDRLGCFTDNIPWAGTAERPIAKLPWPPERIDIRFMLYTRQNALSYQEITPVDPSTISASNYKGGRTTRMITHGFVDKGDENWLKDMCKMMLQVEDINCICIDWKGGSRTLYTQSAQNIRVIGAEIAYLIKLLMNDYNQKPADFHFIGHSLGAHCGGEVGRRIKGLGRITGLDPAEPYFQGTPIEVRLDPSDAIFVDVIHTDSAPMIPYLGFGMSQAVGHLDFYPNGGEQMPGCGKNVASQIVDIDGIWEGTRDFVACNHLRSYKYYADSILNPDGFLGYRCPTVEAFEAGNCFPCPTKGCPMMGHYAPQVRPATNAEQFKFFLNTGEARPFTRWRYKVTMTLIGDRAVRGRTKVSLYGVNGNSRQHELFNTTLRPGSMYTGYIDSEVDIGDLLKVKFIWNNQQLNPLLPKIGVKTLTVQRGKDRREFTFCGSGAVREDILQTLNPC